MKKTSLIWDYFCMAIIFLLTLPLYVETPKQVLLTNSEDPDEMPHALCGISTGSRLFV